MQQSWGRVRLTEVNPHLVCVLCHGYFIDATTMAECPHSFCRSCIVLYLETKSYCPICEVQIHKTKPHLNLKPDKTLQDIVYKLVPGLYHEEMRRRREFYTKYPNRDLYLSPESRGVGVERIIYSPEDLISLSLEYYDEINEVEPDGQRLRKTGTVSNRSEREREEWAPTRPGSQAVVPHQKTATASDEATEGLKRYLQCPAVVTMSHLKKFLRLKYGLSAACTVEILYRRESLPDSYSLMDIAYIYTWKRNGPMRFYYRIHVPTTLRTILPPLKPSSEPIRDLGPPKKLPGSELLDAVGLRPKPPEPQPEPQTDLKKLESPQMKGVEEKEKTLTNVTTTIAKEEETERSNISPEESDAVNQLLALSSAHVPIVPGAVKPTELPELSAPVVSSESAIPATATVTTTVAAPTTTTTAAVEPTKPVTNNGNVFKVPQSMTKRFVFNGGKLVAVKNKQSNSKSSAKPSDKTKVNGKLKNRDNSVDRFINPLGLSGMQGGKLPPGSPRPPPNSEKIMKTKYMPPSGLLMSRLPEVTVSQNNAPVEYPISQKTQVPQVSSSQPQPKQNQNRSVKVNANGNKTPMSNGQPTHRKECNRLEQIVQNCLKKETTQKKEAEAKYETNGVKRSGTQSVNGNGEASEAARAASSIRPPDHGDVDSAALESSILKRKLNDNPFDKRPSLEGPGDPKKRRLVTPDVSIELTTHPSKDKQHKERKREPSDLSTLTKRFLHDIQRTSMKKIDTELKINNLDQMCASTVKIEKVPAPSSHSISLPKSILSGAEKSKPIDSTDFSSEDDQLFIDIRNKCEALKRKNTEPASIAIERVCEDPSVKITPSQPSPTADNEHTLTTSSTPPIVTSETSPKPSGTHKKLPRLIEINAPPRPKLPSLIPDPKQKTGLKMTTVRKEVPIGKEVPLVRRDSNGALDLSSGISPTNKNGSKSPFPRPSSAEKSPTPSALSPLMAMTSFPMPETKSSPIRIPTLKPKTSPNPRPSSLSSSSPSPPAEPRAASEVFPSAAYQQLYRHQMELQSRFLASQVNNNNWSRDPLTAKKFEDWMRNVMNLPHHPLMYPSQLSPEAGRK